MHSGCLRITVSRSYLILKDYKEIPANIDMVNIRVYLLGEMLAKFRKAAMSRFGYGKGSLSTAAEVAISDFNTATQSIAKTDYAEIIKNDRISFQANALEKTTYKKVNKDSVLFRGYQITLEGRCLT